MNLYVHLGEMKTSLGISSTTDDAEMLRILEGVSREADDMCLRHFYIETGSRYYTPNACDRCNIDDALSVSAVAVDRAGDGTFSEAWTEGEEFVLEHVNRFPKTWLRRPRWATKSFEGHENWVKVTGVFGYGTGLGNSPWRPVSVTGTLESASDTSLTLSASGSVHAGMTLLLGTEQLYVEAVSGVTATVTRGVNGTTAAAHTSAAVSVAMYPKTLSAAVLQLSAATYNLRQKGGLKDVMIGEYRETLVWDERVRDQMSVMLGTLKRPMLCAI